MFTAMSDGKMVIAGRITDPKDRTYECSFCGEPVAHVRSTVTSMRHFRAEHFRHKPNSKADHIQRQFTWQRYDVLQFLIDRLEKDYYVETEALFQDRQSDGLDFIVDMLVTEEWEDTEMGAKQQATSAIIIESEPFNSNVLRQQIRYLSEHDIYTMVVLSAECSANPSASYFRDEERVEDVYRGGGWVQEPRTVKNLRKNELALHELFGRNVYFDHDDRTLDIVKFHPYSEYRRARPGRGGGITVPAGRYNLKTRKTHEFIASLKEFRIDYTTREMRWGNLLIACPGPI